MQVLLVSGFNPTQPDRLVLQRVINVLIDSGHEVSLVETTAREFTAPMTAPEQMAYHAEGDNVLTPDVAESVRLLRSADALLFCYPTVAYMFPAPVKNWLDRVLLPGVAFGFNEKGKVRGALTNINRIGVVTTSTGARRHHRLGGLTILRTVRLQCGWRCRRTRLALSSPPDLSLIDRKLASW